MHLSEAQDTLVTKHLTLSIDCGATAEYKDANNITWVPDDSFIRTGVKVPNATSQVDNSYRRYQSSRYFPEKAVNKFCYDLPATNGTTYLVRTTFVHVNLTKDTQSDTSTSFQLHIDSTNVAIINAQSKKLFNNSSNWTHVEEVIMSAVAKNIYVCLAREIGVPFINSIELRALDPQMYQKVHQGYMLITNYRYDMGGDQDVSYPIDVYDRLWLKNPISNVPGYRNLSVTTSNVTTGDSTLSPDNAPERVLNTAIDWPKGTNVSIPFNVSEDGNYVVLLWFAELIPDDGRRIFEVGVDGIWSAPISQLGVAEFSLRAYEWGYDSLNLSRTSQISFNATEDSNQGPILNAMEVYKVSEPIQPRTDDRDVAAIDAIKEHWASLSRWAADPCLYLPYKWVSCSLVPIPRITSLDFVGFNLTGSIPGAAALSNLSELIFLSFENNSLSGPVPDLSFLTKLEQLHLQNNNLTGQFPAWVVNLASLQVLRVEGNNFTGYVPQSLFNKTRFTFTYTSTGLCTGPSPTNCTALRDAETPSESSKTPSGTSSLLGILFGCMAAGFGASIIFGLVCVFVLKPRRASSSYSTRHLLKEDPEAGSDCGAKGPLIGYSFMDVVNATNNFKEQIGEGSYGPTYKGRLSDGKEVLVKRCRPSRKLSTLQFLAEVEHLSKIRHRNLVSLLGYCKESQEQILVYEYLSNGDLRTYLHGGEKPLSSSARLAIALDVALGLQYLHVGRNPGIIHRNVKPANILLSKKMVAKVADFGFVEFTGEKDSKLRGYSVDLTGITGYLDPEFVTGNCHLTDKSDVYGFGVTLLELITGKEVIDKTVTNRDPLLIEWMRPLLAAGKIKDVVDPSLDDDYDEECMCKVAKLGMMCVEPRALDRPTMADVVADLREAMGEMEESA